MYLDCPYLREIPLDRIYCLYGGSLPFRRYSDTASSHRPRYYRRLYPIQSIIAPKFFTYSSLSPSEYYSAIPVIESGSCEAHVKVGPTVCHVKAGHVL